MTTYRIGTSGWIYSHWRERFYPADLPTKRWFEHYAQKFDTVEINNTFYRLPEADQFDAWRQAAPKGFLFTVKASRFLTHMKKLKDPEEPLERLLTRATHLGRHLGPLLYQLPPHWRVDLGRLRDFCAQLPKRRAHVIEFREPSWLTRETFELLARFRVATCIHDIIKNHPREITAPLVYLRFHGVGQKYGGDYSRARLRRWAGWIRALPKSVCTVYAYFNNDANAYAIKNALTLRQLLEASNA